MKFIIGDKLFDTQKQKLFVNLKLNDPTLG